MGDWEESNKVAAQFAALGLGAGFILGIIALSTTYPTIRNLVVVGLQARAFEIGCNIGTGGQRANQCQDAMLQFRQTLLGVVTK